MHLHMCPQTKHRLRFASRESHAPGRAMTTRVHRLEKVVVVATMVRESQRQLRAAGFYHSKCDRKHVTLHGLQLTTPLTGHAGGDCIQGPFHAALLKTQQPVFCMTDDRGRCRHSRWYWRTKQNAHCSPSLQMWLSDEATSGEYDGCGGLSQTKSSTFPKQSSRYRTG
ncbi:unnamed protein product [Mesocestoides corti]|uniref:Uncharacterized protein n=1 Tax=Mesocestoides corti TaxID=53468 RepID=A0A0R3U853_MESCO|nr:unnamed protein product [Mesocestoides corti]